MVLNKWGRGTTASLSLQVIRLYSRISSSWGRYLIPSADAGAQGDEAVNEAKLRGGSMYPWRQQPRRFWFAGPIHNISTSHLQALLILLHQLAY